MDLISRAAAIDGKMSIQCANGVEIYYDEAVPVGYLKALPSAQPKIVRCKDCKWKQGSECVRFAEVRPFPDDFCSRAERRKL